jgi:hypothetical protein
MAYLKFSGLNTSLNRLKGFPIHPEWTNYTANAARILWFENQENRVGVSFPVWLPAHDTFVSVPGGFYDGTNHEGHPLAANGFRSVHDGDKRLPSVFEMHDDNVYYDFNLASNNDLPATWNGYEGSEGTLIGWMLQRIYTLRDEILTNWGGKMSPGHPFRNYVATVLGMTDMFDMGTQGKVVREMAPIDGWAFARDFMVYAEGPKPCYEPTGFRVTRTRSAAQASFNKWSLNNCDYLDRTVGTSDGAEARACYNLLDEDDLPAIMGHPDSIQADGYVYALAASAHAINQGKSSFTAVSQFHSAWTSGDGNFKRMDSIGEHTDGTAYPDMFYGLLQKSWPVIFDQSNYVPHVNYWKEWFESRHWFNGKFFLRPEEMEKGYFCPRSLFRPLINTNDYFNCGFFAVVSAEELTGSGGVLTKTDALVGVQEWAASADWPVEPNALAGAGDTNLGDLMTAKMLDTYFWVGEAILTRPLTYFQNGDIMFRTTRHEHTPECEIGGLPCLPIHKPLLNRNGYYSAHATDAALTTLGGDATANAEVPVDFDVSAGVLLTGTADLYFLKRSLDTRSDPRLALAWWFNFDPATPIKVINYGWKDLAVNLYEDEVLKKSDLNPSENLSFTDVPDITHLATLLETGFYEKIRNRVDKGSSRKTNSSGSKRAWTPTKSPSRDIPDTPEDIVDKPAKPSLIRKQRRIRILVLEVLVHPVMLKALQAVVEENFRI